MTSGNPIDGMTAMLIYEQWYGMISWTNPTGCNQSGLIMQV